LMGNFSAYPRKPVIYTMKSPEFKPRKAVSCFEFFYFMMDDRSHENELALIMVIEDDGGSSSRHIWTTGAPMNVDGWVRSKVQVEQSGKYQVRSIYRVSQNFRIFFSISCISVDSWSYLMLFVLIESATNGLCKSGLSLKIDQAVPKLWLKC